MIDGLPVVDETQFAEAHGFPDGGLISAEVLEGRGQTTAPGDGVDLGEVRAVDGDGSRVRPVHLGEQLDQGGLA